MTKMNVTEIRKGDVVQFKHYALRIETEPKTNGAFVELRGRQSTDGCPLVTKKLNISMVVSVRPDAGREYVDRIKSRSS